MLVSKIWSCTRIYGSVGGYIFNASHLCKTLSEEMRTIFPHGFFIGVARFCQRLMQGKINGRLSLTVHWYDLQSS